MWVGPVMQLPVSWVGHFDATSGIVRYTAAIVELEEPVTSTPGTDAGLGLVVTIPSDSGSGDVGSGGLGSGDMGSGDILPKSPLSLSSPPPSPRTNAGLASVAWVDVPGLAHFKQYHSTVRVRDAVGFETDCQSDGFTTDFTPPEAGTIYSLFKTAANVPNVQTFSHVLHLGWDGFGEPESGIQEMLIGLGTDADPTAIRGFQTVGTGREAVMTALQLAEGHVRVTVRAQNRARLYTESNTTITVDSTPPECSNLGVATPDAGYFYYDANGNLFTQSAQSLVVNWTCFDAYPGRLERTEWAVGTEPGGSDMLSWTETTAAGPHVQDISLHDGSRAYYVTVTVMDWVGLTTFTVSPAIVVDDTPPLSVQPAVLVSNVTGLLRRFWGYANFVDFAARFVDYETGVAQIYASVTLEVQSDISLMRALPSKLWQGGRLPLSMLLSSGAAYHLSVCAVDKLNLRSCSSWPFTVDLQPPNCTSLTDRINNIEKPAFFYLAGALSASWSCVDATSRVVKVEWMAYSSPANDKARRTPLLSKALSHLGSTGEGTATFSFQDGVRYSSCAVAVDLAGWRSEPLCSAGAIYDSTPPSAGTVINGGGEPFFSSVPCTSWAGAIDPHSGIVKLMLQLFLVKGDLESPVGLPREVLAPLNSGSTCYLQNETLQHGVSYFTELVVQNGAGATAEARTIVWTLDTTPPEQGVVLLQLTYPTAFQDQLSFPEKISGVSLRVLTREFTDPDSGVESCAFKVRNALGQVVATGITTPAAPLRSITLPNDVLNGTLFTAAATCINRVGISTVQVASEPWLVHLQTIDVGEVWLVDVDGQRVDSDFVDERHAMKLKYTGATDPSSANTHFQYTWGIVEAPCNVHAGDTRLAMQGSIRPQGLANYPPTVGALQAAAWGPELLSRGRTHCCRLKVGPDPSFGAVYGPNWTLKARCSCLL